MSLPQPTDKQRFDDLVVDYVNGTLEPHAQRWVENYLREHSDARHELAWHQQLREANDTRELQVPSDVGWARLIAQVRAEQRPATTAGDTAHAPRALSLLERLNSLLRDALRPAYALAGLVVLAQAVALGVLLKRVDERDRMLEEYSQTRAVNTQPSRTDTARLHVTFKSDATERQIRMLLVGMQANIVDGPRQLGDYTIALPRARFDQAKVMLQASPIVELVSAQPPSQ